MKRNLLILIALLFFPISEYAQNNNYLKGQVAYEKGNYSDAALNLDIYLNQFPEKERALYLRAKTNIELHNYKKAIIDLERLKLSYHNDIQLFLARAYAGLENTDKAYKLLDIYLQASEKIPETVIESYTEFNNLKLAGSWKSLWEKERYTKKEIMLNNAVFAIKTNKISEALERLDELTTRYPSTGRAHFLKATLLFNKKDYNSALKSFESALESDKENIEYQTAMAACLVKLKKTKKALEQFNAIISSDSLYLPAYKGRAEACLADNNYELAVKDISKYRAYYPDDVEAKYLNAEINVKEGDFLSAISTFGKLIKENPANPDYFIGRANSYMATKTYMYAIKDYSMALDLDPKNVETYKRKAEAHKLAGEIENACNEWKHAADLGDIESLDFLHKYRK